MAYATTDDVAAKFGGLTATLTTRAAVLLEEAAAMLDLVLPTLADAVIAGTVSAILVRKVVTDAVIRVLRNPAGVVSQTIGPEAAQWARSEVPPGQLGFTAAEIELVTPPSTASDDTVSTADGQVIGAARLEMSDAARCALGLRRGTLLDVGVSNVGYSGWY